ncbi:hypothetical protein [Nostoc sp. FACHB-133]|uniref:hypothetical protein n=1 Tax=Nostoc sp. FACHB-133 TaxID=2692835 RepID=UPI0016866A86|nr:hypothetical protein [Nostoc sp. FACHB-133]MBD2527404.1 hypothetical protein [Nostoc sp. FACHB-133]
MEATKLKLQAKSGRITQEGQERLTVLQAKIDGLLNSRLEHATRFGHNITNIPLRRPDIRTPIQAKLTIGEPGDKYEQEADETASQVVQRIHQPQSEKLQRESLPEDDELQIKPGRRIQRESLPEEEDELQMKPMVQRSPQPLEQHEQDPATQRQSVSGDSATDSELENMDLRYYSKEGMQEAGKSSVGHMGTGESIYENQGPTDPSYKNVIQENKNGQKSLKLGWGSAAHIIQVGNSYFLKKLSVGGSIYSPDKTDIQGRWQGKYKEESNDMEIEFPVSAEGGVVNLSEVITFGVSSCSFSVISDTELKNIIIMHINNNQKMPFDEIYDKSPAFREGMTKMFVSMINDQEEVEKVLNAANKAGIKTMDILERPYNPNDADKINLYTHHKLGVAFTNDTPEIFGEQGDSESIFKAVIEKVFKKVSAQIKEQSSFLGNLSEEKVVNIYEEMHSALQNLQVEVIEADLQALDSNMRLRSQGNINETSERRTIFGAKSAFANQQRPEVKEIREKIRKIVDRRFKQDI